MKKLSKYWAITIFFALLTAALPFANEHLAQYGVHITEGEIIAILSAFGITAGAGVAASKRKDKTQTPNSESLTWVENNGQLYVKSNGQLLEIPTKEEKGVAISNIAVPKTKHDTHDVKFGPPGAWYQTNFAKSEKGNVIPYGHSYLWIKCKGARSYITAQLKNDTGFPIQIDQSHDADEDNDHTTTRLELFAKNGRPLPRGKYYLQVQADSGSGDAQGIKEDEFEIV